MLTFLYVFAFVIGLKAAVQPSIGRYFSMDWRFRESLFLETALIIERIGGVLLMIVITVLFFRHLFL